MHRNGKVRIYLELPEPLYDELRIAAADASELDETEVCSPQRFAEECIESVLATRRLDRIVA